MRPPEIRDKIRAADARSTWLSGWIDRLDALRSELLVAQPDPTDTSPPSWRLRRALAAVEKGYRGGELRVEVDPEAERLLRDGEPGLRDAREELARLEEQVALLRDQLPDEAAVARAERRRAELADRAEAAAESTAGAWRALLGAIRGLQPLSVSLVERRQQEVAAREELRGLAAEFGLAASVPPGSALDSGEAREVQVLLELARQALNVAAGSASRLSAETLGALGEREAAA